MISPYAKRGYIDHQVLSFDAYLKFIEDDFLGGQRLELESEDLPDRAGGDQRQRKPESGADFKRPERQVCGPVHETMWRNSRNGAVPLIANVIVGCIRSP